MNECAFVLMTNLEEFPKEQGLVKQDVNKGEVSQVWDLYCIKEM